LKAGGACEEYSIHYFKGYDRDRGVVLALNA